MPPATPPITDPPSPGGLQGKSPNADSHSAISTDNSDKGPTPPQEQGHIRRWFSQVRVTRAAKSTTIIVTALIGFIFGIATNQVSDFVKRADDCYDALAQYETNMAQFPTLAGAIHGGSVAEEQGSPATFQYNNVIGLPSSKILNKCAIAGINTADLKRWEASDDRLPECLVAAACSPGEASDRTIAATLNAAQLAHEATTISQWGLLRRAKYVIMHLY